MLEVTEVVKSIPVDLPPGSENWVGKVDISRAAGMAGYAAIDGYFGERRVYDKQVSDRLSIRPFEVRVENAVAKAVRQVRYSASLAFDLPTATELI